MWVYTCQFTELHILNGYILLYTRYTLLDFLQCNHTAAQFKDIAEEIILSPLYFQS